MAGLPFQQLPATQASPEDDIRKRIKSGRKAVQDRFTLKWNTVNANARYLGKAKHQTMLRDLHAQGKQEMQAFNQEAEQAMAQFNQISNIEQSGGLTPDAAAKLKAGAVYGQKTADAMYPTPKQERSIPQQFGELELYGERISKELEFFKSPDKPSKLGAAVKSLSPLANIISMFHKNKDTLKVWNPNTGEYDKKAEPEDVARYVALLKEEEAVGKRKDELLGHPSIVNRKVQPGTEGGTFGDKVSKSFKKSATQQQPASSDPLGLF